MRKLLRLLSLMISVPLLASQSFQHHDWQVVCDNTNTCRIAGYSSEVDQNKITVLLVRKAGPNEAVTCKIQLGFWSEEDEKMLDSFDSPFRLEMFINDKSYGFVWMKKSDLLSDLSKIQTSALVESLRKSSHISWKIKNHKWVLSDKGSSAVLLKADAYQKRLNTKGALYKKGSKDERHVLPAKLEPMIYAKKVLSRKKVTINDESMHILEKILVLDKEICWIDQNEKNKIALYSLSATKLLASKSCWRAAYNAGSMYWVINKKPPFEPVIITNSGTGFTVDTEHIATISNAHKGRGLGDCWSFEDYVWDGKSFQMSLMSTRGLCRGIAGGAWSLPTFISNIDVQ